MHDAEVVFDEELMLGEEAADSAESSEPALKSAPAPHAPPRSERFRRDAGLRIGELLAGKYRIERVHRPSALGLTLDAVHVQLGQRVAIKLLSADPEVHPEAVARFLRGARSSVQIQNEHVARVLDVGTLPSGVPYAVTEHLAGSDLRHVLRVREALLIPEAVDYMMQACEALADAHGRGIFHRNLKPTNLFLSRRDGAAFLKVLDLFTSEDPLSDAAINQAGTSTSLRSLAYLAPEQIREPALVDARADIWALGAILHEMLTGIPLYEADSTPGLLAAIVADPPTPVTYVRPEIPAELEAIVLRCLAKERAERFSNVLELATELRAFSASEAEPSLERIARGLGRRARTTRPPPLPGEAQKAIVHVPSPPKAEVKAPEQRPIFPRRLAELVVTGIGFGCAAAIGAFAAIRSMQAAVAAPRAVVADLSPALAAPQPIATAVQAPVVAAVSVATTSSVPSARAPRPAPRAPGAKAELAVAPKPAAKTEPHVVIDDSEQLHAVAKNAPAKDLFDDAN